MFIFRTMLLSILMLYLCSCGVEAKQYTTTIHTVQEGEALDSIALLYMTSDRSLPEFREGIIENNYDRIFYNRSENMLYPGDELIITYWEG